MKDLCNCLNQKVNSVNFFFRSFYPSALPHLSKVVLSSQVSMSIYFGYWSHYNESPLKLQNTCWMMQKTRARSLGLLVCSCPSCGGQRSCSEVQGCGVAGFSSELHCNELFPDSQSCPQSREPPVRHLQAVNDELLLPAFCRMRQQDIAKVWQD